MRKFKITVDGRSYEVAVEALDGSFTYSPMQAAPSYPVAPMPVAPAPTTPPPPSPAPVSASVPAPQKAKGANDITSPLAGTVSSLSVKEGQTIADGAEVLVLEAMKMNTPIRATKGGVIKAILVTAGQSVQEGQVLVSID